MSRLAPSLILAMFLAVAAATALHAQGPEEEAPADFRGKVTLAYGIVFGLVVVFIVLSMRRSAGVAADVGFLERRLEELENKVPPG